jgi:hypothetical protein
MGVGLIVFALIRTQDDVTDYHSQAAAAIQQETKASRCIADSQVALIRKDVAKRKRTLDEATQISLDYFDELQQQYESDRGTTIDRAKTGAQGQQKSAPVKTVDWDAYIRQAKR